MFRHPATIHLARRTRLPLLSAFLAVLGLLFALTSLPPFALGFGTIDTWPLGQHSEHERITRAALACPPGKPSSNGECFEPLSLDQLAGRNNTFGAVGAPDIDEPFTPAAHCDDADFVKQSTVDVGILVAAESGEVGRVPHVGAYSAPGARAKATKQLMSCVDHLRRRFMQGRDAAAGLLQGDHIVGPGVILHPGCTFYAKIPGRPKCDALERLGRALHGAQDFYSHSNWADEADPNRPIGPTNPPGLNRSDLAPFLNLRVHPASAVGGGDIGGAEVPPDLSTGCFHILDTVAGTGPCTGHVTHATLNKDKGLIDRRAGDTKDPGTPRGKVKANFAKAVRAPISETRRQWRDMRDAIRAKYGDDRGSIMICALTHDDPVESCDHDPYPSQITGSLRLEPDPLTELEKVKGVWSRTSGTASFEAHKRGPCRYHGNGCTYAIDSAKAKIVYKDGTGCEQATAPHPFTIPGNGPWLNGLPNLTIDFRSVSGATYRNVTFIFAGKVDMGLTCGRTTADVGGGGPQPGPQWTPGQKGMRINVAGADSHGTAGLNFRY